MYIVPNYQRPYTWEESNISDFLNDINIEKEGYYIGNVLFIDKVDPIDTSIKWQEVVDGQQILTSIALIFVTIFQNLEQIL